MKPYYDEDGITIYHGDCREILPQIEVADHIITDPPYSEYVHAKSRAGGSGPGAGLVRDGHRASFSRTADFGFAAITEELRAFCAAEFVRLSRRWILAFSDVESSHLWRDRIVSAGADYCRTGAWIKLGATPQFTGDRPAAGYEAITICHRTGKKRWNGGGSHAVWSHAIELNRGGRSRRLHTTQKPLPLMTRLVALFSDDGETILDPFMGSGTTLRAAKDHGRRAIGVEIDERYCEIAAKRMSQRVLFPASVSP